MKMSMSWILLALALVAVGFGLTRNTRAEAEQPKPADGPVVAAEAVEGNLVTLYKSPTCTCCGAWGDHLRENGFAVREEITRDVQALMDDREIPKHLRSCHFGVVGDYVLVGHVPSELAVRLLAENPTIAGVAVPGMPMGSPGMEGFGRKDRYDVIAFGPGGAEYVYASR